MTTALQAAANVRNGSLSKGPKSPEGKATSAKNALRHGLCALLPVLPGEQPEDWERHHSRIVESLAPVGGLEEELAERVALASWRLRRVAAYETAVTTVGLEEVEQDVRSDGFRYPASSHLNSVQEGLEKLRAQAQEKRWRIEFLEVLPECAETDEVWGGRVKGLLEGVANQLPGKPSLNLKDPAFMAWLGVPEEERDDPYEWEGWTAGMARKAAAHIASRCGPDADLLLTTVLQKEKESLNDLRRAIRRWERVARKRRLEVKVCEDRLRQRRMLCDDKTLDKIMRYEAHLSRQMQQALHTLERLQAARAGRDVPPPAALDITVDAATSSNAGPAVAGAVTLLQHRNRG
jgi:hypothetical protein